MGWKQNLTEMLNKLAGDLTSLDVVTVTGDVDFVFDSEENRGKSVKQVLKDLNASDAAGKAKIVAFTHVDFDQDTVQYIGREQADDLEHPMVKLHFQGVAAAVKTRNEAIRFIGELVKG